MGRTTFEPALSAPHWPWGDRPVFVLGGHRPDETPDHVVVESDPERMLGRLRNARSGDATGNVHLVGGPRTIETFRALGALSEVRLMVLPIMTGSGRRLTPELDVSTGFQLRDVRQWPADVVELSYGVARVQAIAK